MKNNYDLQLFKTDSTKWDAISNCQWSFFPMDKHALGRNEILIISKQFTKGYNETFNKIPMNLPTHRDLNLFITSLTSKPLG